MTALIGQLCDKGAVVAVVGDSGRRNSQVSEQLPEDYILGVLLVERWGEDCEDTPWHRGWRELTAAEGDH